MRRGRSAWPDPGSRVCAAEIRDRRRGSRSRRRPAGHDDHRDNDASPNSHWTVHTTQGGAIDSYFVGNTSATKMSGAGAPGGGQCRRNPGSRPGQFFRDPTEFSGEMTVSRRPDTEIDSTPVHDYAHVEIAPGDRTVAGICF